MATDSVDFGNYPFITPVTKEETPTTDYLHNEPFIFGSSLESYDISYIIEI